MPDTGDAYTHRIGRTGRMAQRGTALSLATQEDLPMIRTIENVLGRALERRKAAGFESSAALIEQANSRPFQANKPPTPSRGLSSNRRRSYSTSYSKR
jgi:ATP-dependent RNA helicase RhlE